MLRNRAWGTGRARSGDESPHGNKGTGLKTRDYKGEDGGVKYRSARISLKGCRNGRGLSD